MFWRPSRSTLRSWRTTGRWPRGNRAARRISRRCSSTRTRVLWSWSTTTPLSFRRARRRSSWVPLRTTTWRVSSSIRTRTPLSEGVGLDMYTTHGAHIIGSRLGDANPPLRPATCGGPLQCLECAEEASVVTGLRYYRDEYFDSLTIPTVIDAICEAGASREVALIAIDIMTKAGI